MKKFWDTGTDFFMRAFWDTSTGFAIGLLLILGVPVAAVVTFAYQAEKRGCIQSAEILRMPYEWRAFGGCWIEYKPGQHVQLERYYVVSRGDEGVPPKAKP
jgi:cbb3-type cytochrome oxidase subunit 3